MQTVQEIVEERGIASAKASGFKHGPSMEDDLWNAARCAKFFGGVSPEHFLYRIRPLPDFPTPIVLPTGRKGSHPLWVPKEVREWAHSYKN